MGTGHGGYKLIDRLPWKPSRPNTWPWQDDHVAKSADHVIKSRELGQEVWENAGHRKVGIYPIIWFHPFGRLWRFPGQDWIFTSCMTSTLLLVSQGWTPTITDSLLIEVLCSVDFLLHSLFSLWTFLNLSCSVSCTATFALTSFLFFFLVLQQLFLPAFFELHLQVRTGHPHMIDIQHYCSIGGVMV